MVYEIVCVRLYVCVGVCFVFVSLGLCTPAKPPVPQAHLWSPGRWLIWKYNHAGQNFIFSLRQSLGSSISIPTFISLSSLSARRERLGNSARSALSPLLLRVIHLNSRGPGGSQLTCRDLNGAWATVNQPVLERGHGVARGMSKTCVCVWACVSASVRGSGCVTHRFSRLSSRSDGSVRALLEKWKSALLFSERLHYIIAFRKGFICQTGWVMQKYSACVSFSCDQCEWLLHTVHFCVLHNENIPPDARRDSFMRFVSTHLGRCRGSLNGLLVIW